MQRKGSLFLFFVLNLSFCILFIAGCTPDDTAPAATADPTLTPTVTVTAVPPVVPTATTTPTATAVAPQLPTPTTAPPPSACDGLTGNLAMSVLVGPSDAVGLEPAAVGQIPFATSGSEAPYPVSGSGTIDYAATLEKEWGSYTVTMNMVTGVTGSCSGAAGMEMLNLTVEATGDQLVVVTTEGFQGEYPWNGTHSFQLEFPLTNGATQSGEGWTFMLLLGDG